MDREILSAVHDNEFEQFLRNINQFDNIQKGLCHCKYCGETITVENIYSVFPESGTINFVCDKMNCIVSFMNNGNKKQ